VVPNDLVDDGTVLLSQLRSRGLSIATGESCTGGLITAVLTAVAGSSDVVDRGFVTYSNAAKTEMLDVPAALIEEHGAVSSEVATAMLEGIFRHCEADIAVSVTGIAGPSGGSAEKPVGLVYVTAGRRGGPILAKACRFGDIGRTEVRLASVRTAFALVRETLEK
jgi:nicotinamide-nucleotide amidase